MENAIKAMGIEVVGSEMFPRVGEIFTEDIRAKLGRCRSPDRFCPRWVFLFGRRCFALGCPHRAVFYVLHKLKLNVSGDIGC